MFFSVNKNCPGMKLQHILMLYFSCIEGDYRSSFYLFDQSSCGQQHIFELCGSQCKVLNGPAVTCFYSALNYFLFIESQCELGGKGIPFQQRSYLKLNEGSGIPIHRHNYHSKTWVSPVQITGFCCWFIITCRYDSISKLGIFQTLPVALNPSGPLCVLSQLPALPGAIAEQIHLLMATLFCSFGFLREQD